MQYRNSVIGASNLPWTEAEQKFLAKQKLAYEKVKKEKIIFDFDAKASDDGSSVVYLKDPSALADSSLTGEELCLALAYMFQTTASNTFVVDWRAIEGMWMTQKASLGLKLQKKIGNLQEIGFEAVFNMRKLYVMGKNAMVGVDEKSANVRLSMPVDMQQMI